MFSRVVESDWTREDPLGVARHGGSTLRFVPLIHDEGKGECQGITEKKISLITLTHAARSSQQIRVYLSFRLTPRYVSNKL